MSATDAAVNIMVTLLRADSVLSLPNGTGPGQNPAGVKGEVYQGSSDTTETFPRTVTYPAIAVVVQSSVAVPTMGTGRVVQWNGVLMVKIVATGGNLETERRIAERVRTVLLGVKRQTWTRGLGEPVYYVSDFCETNEQPQPNEAVGDRIFRFKNIVYRSSGYRRS